MKRFALTSILILGCGGGDKKVEPPKPDPDMKPAGGDTTTTTTAPEDKKEPPAAPVPPPPPDTGGYSITAVAAAKFNPIDPSNAKGPELAVLHGDPKSGGAYFFRMPPGFKSGIHTHTADYHAVVVSGAPKHFISGGEGKAKALAAGSYWMQPGGQQHGDECTGTEPCVLFIIQQGAFDFASVAKGKKEAAGKYKLVERKTLKFAPLDPKQPQGLKASFVFGDPKTGPLGLFLEVPPKGSSGAHSHTATYHALVLEGSAGHWLPHEPETTPAVGPGTYWFQPGGYDHYDRCDSAEPCRAFVFFEGAMDMKPGGAKK